MEDTIGSTYRSAANPADATVTSPAVRAALAAAGFQPRDTGEGTMAWSRRVDAASHVMISASGRLDGAPDRAVWTAGRYGTDGGFVEVAGLALTEAIDATAILPMPVRTDGSLAEAMYPTVDEAMSDFA